uniref:Glutathione S-transferase omega n=1 Tax=Cyprinus carpio TaxID=7962 RepID=A0A8C1XKE6_CYPCA
MAESQKCLGKGSPAPGPVPKKHIQLYSMRFCPFAQWTRLVLNWQVSYLRRMKLGMKVFFCAEDLIWESPITCEYLNEVYPEKKLLPSDPFERAQQKMLMNGCSSQVTPYFYKTPVSKTKGEDVSALEAELKRNSPNLMMIDYMMWPWFERMEMMDLNNTHADNFFILSSCLDGTPQLKKWTEHMLEDPPVKATVFSTDNYKVFYKSYMEGTPDYDYGL